MLWSTVVVAVLAVGTFSNAALTHDVDTGSIVELTQLTASDTIASVQFPKEVSTEKNIIIEVLDQIIFNTAIGEVINVNLTHTGFRETESCTLRTPDGNNHNLDQNFKLDGVEVFEHDTITCGVIINVISESFKGDWLLIVREFVLGSDVDERWLPFTIDVKDTDSSIEDNSTSSLNFKLNAAVDIEVGPEDAIYCILYKTQNREKHFEGLGRCRLVLERVTADHTGEWTIQYGLAGKTHTQYSFLQIAIDPKPVVSTEVIKEQPTVFLFCSVVTSYEPKLCRFINPSGDIIFAVTATPSFNAAGTVFNGSAYTYECGLQIDSPTVSELGMWSCAIDTEEETYHGFLSVICPWAMQDPSVAAQVVAEPTLVADTSIITAAAGDRAILSCSIKAPIRYCYFRNGNDGSTITVYPGISSNNFEYVGAGFDAGVCGVRINSMSPSDSGNWSCHVGLEDSEQPEQSAVIEVHVALLMEVSQSYQEGGELYITGTVGLPLEYCRFVRIDGFGFTSEAIPSGYASHTSLSSGVCGITIANPNVLEHHEWTVAAKIIGRDGEASSTTGHSLDHLMPGDTNDPSEEHLHIPHPYSGMPVLFVISIVFGVFFVVFGCSMFKKEPRRWVVDKSSALRNSFRKQPPPPAAVVVDEKPPSYV